MKDKEIDYLDGEFTILENVPSSLPELAELVGDDMILDEAVSNLYYRNKYPRVYRAVSEAIAPAFKRRVVDTKTNKDKTVKEIFESPMDHIRGYLEGATNDPEVKLTGDDLKPRRDELAELFKTIGNAQPLYVKGERTGGGGKISKEAQDKANAFFAEGVDKVEAVAAKIESVVSGYTVARDADGNVTTESLARGIMALTKHLQREAQAAALNALA